MIARLRIRCFRFRGAAILNSILRRPFRRTNGDFLDIGGNVHRPADTRGFAANETVVIAPPFSSLRGRARSGGRSDVSRDGMQVTSRAYRVRCLRVAPAWSRRTIVSAHGARTRCRRCRRSSQPRASSVPVETRGKLDAGFTSILITSRRRLIVVGLVGTYGMEILDINATWNLTVSSFFSLSLSLLRANYPNSLSRFSLCAK